MTSADLSMSRNSLSIFIPGHRGLKCCINERGAVRHYELTGQYIQVFLSVILPPVVREATLMRMCLYSVDFCLSRGTWKSWAECAARLTLRFFIPPSHCFSSPAEETSQLGQNAWLECSHFEERVPAILWGCVCCPGETERDVSH